MYHVSTRIQPISSTRYTVSKRFFEFWKRTTDIVLALVGLCLFLFPMVIICLFIILDSPGPALYRQERLGLNGKPFVMLKFRTMVLDAEKDGPKMTSDHDTRITRIGRFLRRTKLDELPQLLHVLNGEMSLVGPRPERPCFYRQFETHIPNFSQRLVVKPGITGWAQVHGGYDLSPEEKLQYDLEYIQKHSIRMDLLCLFLTVFVVLSGQGTR